MQSETGFPSRPSHQLKSYVASKSRLKLAARAVLSADAGLLVLLLLDRCMRILDFKVKKLYFGFVDLEKAFDRVPREVIRWAMRKLGVEEWLVSAVMSMYIVAKTVVRTV